MKAAARLLLILALIAPAFASAQVQASPAPTCKLFASATTVKPNTKVRLDWTTTNVSSGYLTEVGTIAPNGLAYVVPGKNTTYAASFTGPGGSIVCRVAIAVSATAPASGGGSVNGSGTVDTNNPINTNVPVNLDRTVNLGGDVTLPTAPSVAPTTPTSGSGGFLGGIVPAECRSGPAGTDPLNTVKNCDFCSLNQLMQNLVNFLLGLTIPVAALLFAWAGILFFSSRGEPAQINRAKGIFKTVVIGFVIAISAWILVNTAINMLVTGTEYKNWSWNKLDCTATRLQRQAQINKSLQDYLNSSLPGLQSYTAPVGGTAYECTTGVLQNGSCVDASGNTVGTPVQINSSQLTNAQQDELQDRCEDEGDAAACKILNSYLNGTSGGTALGCSQYGSAYAVAGTQCYGDDGVPIGPALRPGELTTTQQDQLQDECEEDGNKASCAKLAAALGESSGNAIANVKRWDAQVAAACENASSMNDCGKMVQAIMTNESGGNCSVVSNVGAQGCMQLMPTTACGVNPSIDGCGTCKSWADNTGANCSAVRQALISDPALNIQTGTQELARLSRIFNNDPTLVAAAYNGGQKANNYSTACGGGTAWQCTLNPGYAETRNYVVKVNNTLTKLK